jgi:hypothetical protein
MDGQHPVRPVHGDTFTRSRGWQSGLKTPIPKGEPQSLCCALVGGRLAWVILVCYSHGMGDEGLLVKRQIGDTLEYIGLLGDDAPQTEPDMLDAKLGRAAPRVFA